MYGVGNYPMGSCYGLGADYLSDPYSQGYYNFTNTPFVGGTQQMPAQKHELSSDVFVSRKKDDTTEKILLLGVLGIAIGAYILKGKVSMSRLFSKVKK